MKIYMAPMDTPLNEMLNEEYLIMPSGNDEITIEFEYKGKEPIMVGPSIRYDGTTTAKAAGILESGLFVNVIVSDEAPPGVIQFLENGEIYDEYTLEDFMQGFRLFQADEFEVWIKEHHRYPRTSEVALLKKLGVNGFGFKKGSGN